ncbi:nucleotide sugar dehydratase [Spirochaetia bacterium]|nr:nucleotide sugar dehydratase [Spirochaetia bacterium]
MYKIEAPNDRILQEDLDYLAGHFDFTGLYHSSVLITGSTGLIGSQLVKVLLCLNRTKNADITIYALIRDVNKAKKIFHGLYEKINFFIGDITTIPQIDGPVDYILHGASITASKTFIEKPVETIDTAYIGTRTMLDFAGKKNVKGFVYLSSMEVFGITDTRLKEVTESDYGYIDILNPRSSYSESKRMCECLCTCYTKEYNLPVKIARLTQVLGAGVDYNDTRVAAQFARSVIEGKNIVLKTEGKTLRPCVYTQDAVSGIFTVLLKGNAGEAYSIGNADTTITIRETAEMVVEKIANNAIKVVLDIDVPAEYAPNLNLNLNLNLNRIESLGWKAEIGIEEAYRRMIESMGERKGQAE